MQRDLILTDSEKKARRDTIEQNRQKKLKPSKTSTASESVFIQFSEFAQEEDKEQLVEDVHSDHDRLE